MAATEQDSAAPARDGAGLGRLWRALAVIVSGFVIVNSFLLFRHTQSADLLATWLAGRAFALGLPDQIYAATGAVFTMEPPTAWRAWIDAQHHDASAYPFIYPPLWAWVGSLLYRAFSLSTLIAGANLLNPAVLVASLWLALRNTVPPARLAPMFLLGLLLTGLSIATIIALAQNQPQIIVGFLCILAVDRMLRDAPRSAGIALALAASIKLYPAVFALFFLARRDWAALRAFLVAGLALGLASIAVAGWPLHQAFLAQIGAISRTALTSFISWSLDSTLAKLVFRDSMIEVFDNRIPISGTEPGSWFVMLKPPLWRAVDAALQLAALAGLYRIARRTADPLFWPLAFTVTALLSPLAWGYHFLAAYVFLPALFTRLPTLPALGLVALIVIPQSAPFVFATFGDGPAGLWQQPLATAACVLMAVAFAWALRHPAISRT